MLSTRLKIYQLPSPIECIWLIDVGQVLGLLYRFSANVFKFPQQLSIFCGHSRQPTSHNGISPEMSGEIFHGAEEFHERNMNWVPLRVQEW